MTHPMMALLDGLPYHAILTSVLAGSRLLVRAVFALTSLMFAHCRAARWKLFMHRSAILKACSTASASCW